MSILRDKVRAGCRAAERLMRPNKAGAIFGARFPDHRSILGNGARLMGLNWAEMALGAAYFALMARFLGPSSYAGWAYGVAAYTLIVGFAGLGFDALMLLRLGRDQRDGDDIVGQVLTLRLVLLALGALTLAAYALLAEPDPASRIVLLLFIPALLGRGAALATRTCFVAYERLRDYAKFVVFFRAAEAACGSLYLVAGGGLIGVILLHAALWTGEAIFGLYLVRTRLAPWVFCFRLRTAAELLRQGTVLGISAIGFNWLASGPIMLLAQTALSPAELGQFALISNLTMVMAGSGHAFLAAAVPVLRRSAQPDVAIGYGRMAALAIAVASAAACGLGWLFGPALVMLVFGPGYPAADSLVVPFLLIGGLILVPTGYEQALLIARRRWVLALAYIAGSICLVVGLPAAVALYGLDGALAATMGAWLVRAAQLIGVAEFSVLRRRRMGLLRGSSRMAGAPKGRVRTWP